MDTRKGATLIVYKILRSKLKIEQQELC